MRVCGGVLRGVLRTRSGHSIFGQIRHYGGSQAETWLRIVLNDWRILQRFEFIWQGLHPCGLMSTEQIGYDFDAGIVQCHIQPMETDSRHTSLYGPQYQVPRTRAKGLSSSRFKPIQQTGSILSGHAHTSPSEHAVSCRYSATI